MSNTETNGPDMRHRKALDWLFAEESKGALTPDNIDEFVERAANSFGAVGADLRNDLLEALNEMCCSSMDEDECCDFADPGGNSALRAATASNPRNQPCPTCGGENLLTPADVRLGYQCDRCADRAERGYDC